MFPLFTLALLAAAAPDEAPIIVVQIARSQELVYRGDCEVIARGAGSSSRRNWTLQSRAMVLETTDEKAEIALYTAVREPIPSATDASQSVRLSIMDVDFLGRIKSDPAVPLDNPAPLDAVAFLELPGKPMTAGLSWVVNEPGRPPRTWTVIGNEQIGATRCWKVRGEQATSGWDTVGTHRAWRRQDVAWIDPRGGIVRRLERTIDLRDPSRREVTSRAVTRYELESNLTYPQRLDAERRAEIMLAWQTERAVAELASNGTAQSSRSFDALQRRLTYHCGNHPATPYRDAVLAAERTIGLARRGELQLAAAMSTAPVELAVGQVVPEFVANDLSTGSAVRVGRPANRPLVLVFFRADSDLAEIALRTAGEVCDRADVVGLCVSDDTPAALRLGRSCGSKFPILDGREAQSRYTANSTPRFVVLDTNGSVRLLLDGYGSEVGALLAKAAELAGCNR